MEERIQFVTRFIRAIAGIDISDYLSKVFSLDRIILNEDRHLNNLALIFTGTKFLPAPIFDNGISLLTANQSVNWRLPLEENIKKVVARPFSGSHEKMQNYFGKGFQINMEAVLDWLAKEPQSHEKEVLEYQIKRYSQ